MGSLTLASRLHLAYTSDLPDSHEYLETEYHGFWCAVVCMYLHHTSDLLFTVDPPFLKSLLSHVNLGVSCLETELLKLNLDSALGFNSTSLG